MSDRTGGQSKPKPDPRGTVAALVGNDERLVDRLLAHARTVALGKGQFVFHPGDLCEAFLVLVDGSIRVQLTAANGREVTLYRISPGGTCALTTSCLLGAENYPAEAITETDVVAVAIPAAAFQELLETSKAFRLLVFDGFSSRLKNVIAKIEDLAFTGIDARLARLLLELDDQGVGNVTHQDMAVELGTAREVVSRHLKRFESEGWVELGRGHVAVNDRPALERIATTLE